MRSPFGQKCSDTLREIRTEHCIDEKAYAFIGFNGRLASGGRTQHALGMVQGIGRTGHYALNQLAQYRLKFLRRGDLVNQPDCLSLSGPDSACGENQLARAAWADCRDKPVVVAPQVQCAQFSWRDGKTSIVGSQTDIRCQGKCD